MKTFKEYIEEKSRCWKGYKPVKGKKPYTPGSCEKVSEQNDNPDPENIKNALIDSKRKLMKSKTDAERDFYTKKIKALEHDN